VLYYLPEYEDGEWPVTLGEPRPRVHSTQSEPGTLKRFSGQPQTEMALYNMAAMMASIGAGFDIRISNFTAIHPLVPGATELENEKRDSYIGRRRDAHFAAIRDSFIEPENSFGSPAGDRLHLKSNTYHGPMPRTRGSIDFNTLPSESIPLDHCNGDGYRSADSLASTTQSSDDIFAVTATPSLTSCASSPFRSSGDNVVYDSSLSTSLDSEGIDCRGCKHHQSSAASSPALLESAPSVVHRSSNPRSIRRSRDSRRLRLGFRSETDSTTPKCNANEGGPVRPTTLDINGHVTLSPNGTTPSLMDSGGSGRKPRGYKFSQISAQSSGASDDSYLRSVTSPGSTPPHIDHPRTILNIEVDSIVSTSSCECLQVHNNSSLSCTQAIHFVSPTTFQNAVRQRTPVLEERPPVFVRTNSALNTSVHKINGTVSPQSPVFDTT